MSFMTTWKNENADTNFGSYPIFDQENIIKLQRNLKILKLECVRTNLRPNITLNFVQRKPNRNLQIWCFCKTWKIS